MLTNINFLLLCNAIIWLTPPFFQKGVNRYYLLIVAFLFSQSYWTFIVLLNIFQFNLPSNIIENSIPDALYYSAIAGLTFSLSTALFIKKNIRQIKARHFFIENPLKKIPKAHSIAMMIRLFVIISLIYSYISAINYIGVGDRIEFMDNIAPFWYTTLLPLNAVLLGALIAYDLRWSRNSLSLMAKTTTILIFFHIFLVGFDGSRRYSIMPIVAMGFSLFSLSIDTQEKKPKLIKSIFYLMLFFLITSTALILNRNGLVGWQMFVDNNLTFQDFSSIVASSLFAAMPTIHVNTQMADLTNLSGAQGYSYYFYAIGNTLFPKFIFQHYFFGDPLVSVLHERFGWYGQDFGFLAEAIYAGKTQGVIIMHFIFGFVVAQILNRVHLRKLFFLACAVGLLYGMTNSLRSDFMNLLKASLYSSIVIYIGLLLLKNKKSTKIQSNFPSNQL